MADSLKVSTVLGGILVAVSCLKNLLAVKIAVNQLYIQRTRRTALGVLATSRSILWLRPKFLTQKHRHHCSNGRKFWIRPGQRHSWWSNFLAERVVAAEWIEVKLVDSIKC